MTEKFKIAIIGSGPSGLSAAAHAAELGVSHILLEAEKQPANTIYKYQKGKHAMAEPEVLPLRSPMTFAAGSREKILSTWDQELSKYRVNIRYNSNVTSISGNCGDFRIALANGESVSAEFIVLAIGLQGNIRKLGAPGEDLPNVQYQLDDPDEYADETIIIVGAGDAAIENAIALMARNRVILVNRNEEFSRCKEGNLQLLNAAVKEGKMETRVRTTVERVEEKRGDFKMHFFAKTKKGDELTCDANGPACIFIYKTISEPHVGEMSFFKVYSGTVKSGMELENETTGATEKIAQLFLVEGNKRTAGK